MDRLRTASRGALAATTEVVAALSVATVLVAVIREVAPAAGLTIIYLLAVLLVAVRRGSSAALLTSVLGVVLFNLFFIEPRFELAVARSSDFVTLALFLVVSVVVGRLAATTRRRSEQAEAATSVAHAREREARVLASTAASVFGAGGGQGRGRAAVEAVGAALPGEEETGLAIVVGDRPADSALHVVPLDTLAAAWLCGREEGGWDEAALGRLAGPMAKICELVDEQARLDDTRASAEAARTAEAAKTSLLHAVSHDLRSPLTAISTAASAMTLERLPDRDHVALLTVIREESERLSRLVDDLLDVSRIEAAAVNPNRDWCHVNEVAARAVALVRRRSAHPIELALPEEVLLIHADSVQLERVLVNLLGNAVDHSPPNAAPVRLSGGVGRGRVNLRVTDHGRGIPLSRRRRIFEPFFKGRGSEGSGLGLTICRGFTEANGGSIRIDDAPGGGTSISVSFPLASHPLPT